MNKIIIFLVVITIMTSSCTLKQNSQQKATKAQEINKDSMAQVVKQEILHAWNGYKKFAWGHDDLRPLTAGYHDWYKESFYMTAVDGLDLLYLIGEKQEADETKEYIIKHLSFDKDIYVKGFEINIRLLGSLLANYEITGDKRLLNLAEDLGKRLLPAYKSPTNMPFVMVNLKTGRTKDSITNPAEVGSALIEMGILSRHTGNKIYYNAAKKAMVEMFNRRSKLNMIGDGINMVTGKWTNKVCHIGCCIDSYFEYLLKASILYDDKECANMWKLYLAAVNEFSAETVDLGFWYGRVDMETGKKLYPQFGALDAYFPAVLALGGDIERAKKLHESCVKMWNAFGIEPEMMDYNTFNITESPYHLRPEIVESAYYLYHFTKDPKYLKIGKDLFDSFVKYCRTEHGFAALKDVSTKEKADEMESFVLGETLKYFYLLFAPESTLDFEKVIFSTEAHPFKRIAKN